MGQSSPEGQRQDRLAWPVRSGLGFLLWRQEEETTNILFAVARAGWCGGHVIISSSAGWDNRTQLWLGDERMRESPPV
jgi:hypothetical protein